MGYDWTFSGGNPSMVQSGCMDARERYAGHTRIRGRPMGAKPRREFGGISNVIDWQRNRFVFFRIDQPLQQESDKETDSND